MIDFFFLDELMGWGGGGGGGSYRLNIYILSCQCDILFMVQRKQMLSSV